MERLVTAVDPNRLGRAQAIASDPRNIQQVKNGIFKVHSQSSSGAYRVAINGASGRCSCPDFVDRGTACKHVLAVRQFTAGQVAGANPPLGKRIRLQYPQVREAYDLGQTEEIRLFDTLLHDVLADVPEPERDQHHAGRHPIPLRDQLFCAVQKVYSQLSCRRAAGLFENALARGQIDKVPHYTLSSEALSRPELTPILLELITKSALPLAALESVFAIDSTGIRTTSFGAWCSERHGEARQNVWLKAHALVGVETHVFVRVAVTGKDGADIVQFEPLIREAAERGIHLAEVCADKAYSSRAHYALAKEIGFDLWVPFRSNSTGRRVSRGHSGQEARSELWRKAFLFFQMRREEFYPKYHRRSNVESVFSALKRKFGDTIRSKNPSAQINELLAKILAYNLTVVIHEMFEHGVVPEFLRGTNLQPAC